MPDILGIGALNVDYISSKSKMKLLEADTFSELSNSFEHGTERPASREEVVKHLEKHSHIFERFMGGSAFNTIHTSKYVDPHLNTGFIGVTSNNLPNDADFLKYFEANQVDTTNVRVFENELSGTCISYIIDGERRMLTNPGVNERFHEVFGNQIDEIVEYASHFRIVHISSLFDDKSPQVIAEFVRKLKERYRNVKISFDPGHHWSENANNAVYDILKYCDILFVNNREFRMLGKGTDLDSEKDIAETIMDLISEKSIIIVQKKYDKIKSYFRVGSKIQNIEHHNASYDAEEIEDATGAGDVFAGAFLAASLSPGFSLKNQIEIGLRLVKEKLRWPGHRGFSKFSSIYESYVNEICATYDAIDAGSVEVLSSSTDFLRVGAGARSINYNGKTYEFTSKQASVIEFLIDAWKSGTPSISGAVLEEELNVSRIDNLFKKDNVPHEAWGVLIGPGNTKGVYKIMLDFSSMQVVEG